MDFVIKKTEDFLTPIAAVEVDGIEHAYLRDGSDIRIETAIESGGHKDVRILYYSDYQVGSFSYSDKGLKDKIIRSLTEPQGHLSDAPSFRR